jgi:four helix bundle protein
MEDIYSNYDPNRDFTTLVAWERARALRIFFYKEVIQKLPAEEKYNLNVQIRKASVSSTANIAEGYGRYYPQESIQFYRVSRASVYELKDHLISCHDNQYITDEVFQTGLVCIEVAKVAINGYIKYVMRRKNEDNG